MAKNNLIDVYCFGIEIGKIGLDENESKSFFQFNPEFLAENKYPNLFPNTGSIRRVPQTQVFSQYNNEVFKGLPPQIADSLPDMFGNILFMTWLESSHNDLKKINALQQLAYIGNRGMGALEYRPSIDIPAHTSIDLNEITEVLKAVLDTKNAAQATQLNNQGLINIFKIGTSAGGARPKILISEHKQTGEIIPGDIAYSDAYNHYIVKLDLDELGYKREVIEYCYYLTARHIAIRMMPSKIIDHKHFATLRYDRQEGKKKHILTATGLTGWSFKDPDISSYENLFDLALFLKTPHAEVQELFKRMVFNVVFSNTDDHLKNHSFAYNETNDKWNMTPAYDLTYSLNPLINYKRTSRALSINTKRVDISLADVLTIADKYTIKNPKGIIEKVQSAIVQWEQFMQEHKIPSDIIKSIQADFSTLK